MSQRLLFLLFCCWLTQCAVAQSPLKLVIFDYPHGHTRLHVESQGETRLYYGALPQYRVVRPGTFQIQAVRKALEPHLHPLVPREEWPDVQAESGMVTFVFEDGSKDSFLIFEAEEITEPLFERARDNATEGFP